MHIKGIFVILTPGLDAVHAICVEAVLISKTIAIVSNMRSNPGVQQMEMQEALLKG
jgi:hypothetical protein